MLCGSLLACDEQKKNCQSGRWSDVESVASHGCLLNSNDAMSAERSRLSCVPRLTPPLRRDLKYRPVERRPPAEWCLRLRPFASTAPLITTQQLALQLPRLMTCRRERSSHLVRRKDASPVEFLCQAGCG